MAFKMAGWGGYQKDPSSFTKETNYLDDKQNPPKPPKDEGPKGKMGSEYRKAEYDKRGWKYDDTIAGYNRDGTKIEAPAPPKPKSKAQVKTEKVVKKGDDKKAKIAAKAAVKTGEVTENVDRKSARIAKRAARKEHGRDSKEFLEAKGKHLETKETDRQGGKGGRKQSIVRKASSKINKKRQEKNKAKLDAKNAE